jgi:hypothetical protein
MYDLAHLARALKLNGRWKVPLHTRIFFSIQVATTSTEEESADQ